jgi:hypothetical protein
MFGPGFQLFTILALTDFRLADNRSILKLTAFDMPENIYQEDFQS